MKKYLYMLFSFLLNSSITLAQFHDNTTILGLDGASIDFLIGLPDDSLDNTILSYSEGNVRVEVKKYLGIDLIWHTNSPFSDKDGNFTFFSNGTDVYDKNFKPLASKPLTKPLYDNNYNQFNLSLPIPSNDNKAVLIYGNEAHFVAIDPSTGFPSDSGFLYSQNLYFAEIAMKGTGGVAELISKENLIINDTVGPGKFTAT